MSAREESLFILAVPAVIWAVHFLLAYGTAAIWCGKVAGQGGDLGAARVAIAVYTAVALAGIAVLGWRKLRPLRADGPALPYDSDSSEGRHRFLAFATLLLCGLSGVAIVYEALAIVFIGSCV